MPGILRLLIAAALLVLAGCDRLRKSEADHSVAVAPQPVVIMQRVYVPIPKVLTAPEPIAEGPIAQCFDVAAQRRAAQERANAKLKQIGLVQGTEVKP